MDNIPLPSELKFTPTHEWARLESDGSITVGITDHAQHLLGDIVYIELPIINKFISQGGEIAVVESVKAASDVYSPVNGHIIAINSALQSNPALINQSPYEDGWIFCLRPDNSKEIDALLNSQAYSEHINTDK